MQNIILYELCSSLRHQVPSASFKQIITLQVPAIAASYIFCRNYIFLQFMILHVCLHKRLTSVKWMSSLHKMPSKDMDVSLFVSAFVCVSAWLCVWVSAFMHVYILHLCFYFIHMYLFLFMFIMCTYTCKDCVGLIRSESSLWARLSVGWSVCCMS